MHSNHTDLPRCQCSTKPGNLLPSHTGSGKLHIAPRKNCRSLLSIAYSSKLHEGATNSQHASMCTVIRRNHFDKSVIALKYFNRHTRRQ